MLYFVLATIISFTVYFAVVRPKLREFRNVVGIMDMVDAHTASRWEQIRLWAWGQKTAISGMLGILITTLPGVLEQLHAVDFAPLFGPEVALKISGAIMLGMTVLHIVSVVAAGRIQPAQSDVDGER